MQLPITLILGCALCASIYAQSAADLGRGVGLAVASKAGAASRAPVGGQYLSINGYAWDDSVSETAVGISTSPPPQGTGGLVWFQYYDTRDPAFANAPSDVITHVEVALGSLAVGPVAPPAGSTYEVYVYEDPNDDGMPNDLVLLTQQGDTLMAPDLDVLEPTPITPTTVQGQFMVACFMSHVMSTNPPTPGVGEFPAALDRSVSSLGRAWVLGAVPETTWNPMLPNAPYAIPLQELDALGLPGVWLLRAIGNGERGSIRYCTAKAGLTCGPPSIRTMGSSRAGSPEGFVVMAGPARGCRSGVLLYNTSPGNTAFQGGTLCLDMTGLRRAGSTNSGGTATGCDGEFAIDMNRFAAGMWQVPDCAGEPSGFPSSMPAAYLSTPGTEVFCQYWGRDSMMTGSFLSDALSYIVGASVDLALEKGYDLYQTSSAEVRLDLPAGFFDPGSDPFTGLVQLMGRPFQTAGPFEMGFTDTVVERLDRFESAITPGVETIQVELVALSLTSIQPITVMIGGHPTFWDVDVDLGMPPEWRGVMRVDRLAPNGGTFDSILPVRPMLTFTRGMTSVLFDPGVIPLVGKSGNWTDNPGCSSKQIGKPRLPVGFCQGTMLSSSLLDLDLMPAQPDPGHPPPAYVDPGASVHPQVGSLGRGCVISNGAVVGPGAIIGPNAFVGQNAMVGSGAVVGDGAVLGAQSDLGDLSVLGNGSLAGPKANIAPDTVVGTGCSIGEADLGGSTIIGDFSIIGDFVQIGGGVECGEKVLIRHTSMIAPMVRIAPGTFLPPGTKLLENIYACISAAGATGTGTAGQCQAKGDTILGLVPLGNSFEVKPQSSRRVMPINPQALPPALANLGADINMAAVAPMSNGGTAPNFVDGTNDCDDFAERLEMALQAKGYDATFTIVWTVNKNRSWYEFWKRRFTGGHAVTDVHSGGRTIWIEPQFTRVAALGVNMDNNNDGRVQFETQAGTSATDGCLRVEVYPDRRAAERQWGSLD
jgi:carbonic anhydrase/acetyltransferase-like protein (isoleucine patch superfamily)